MPTAPIQRQRRPSAGLAPVRPDRPRRPCGGRLPPARDIPFDGVQIVLYRAVDGEFENLADTTFQIAR
ncbi:MAG: hypothetical protein R2873_12655 [Caldilineaceae bacterium]